MTLFRSSVLAAGGLRSPASINAVAGGGTFITFAALVASGLPTLDANATSAVALTPANLASVAAYRSEVAIALSRNDSVRDHRADRRRGRRAAADLARRRRLPPAGAVAVADRDAAVCVQRPIRAVRRAVVARAADRRAQLVAYGVMVVVSIYGGFFGAGMGIMMLAALLNHRKRRLPQGQCDQDHRRVSDSDGVGGDADRGGLVHWPQALVTIAASSLGGYFGVGFARDVPEKIIRAAVVAIGAVLTVVFFLSDRSDTDHELLRASPRRRSTGRTCGGQIKADEAEQDCRRAAVQQRMKTACQLFNMWPMK